MAALHRFSLSALAAGLCLIAAPVSAQTLDVSGPDSSANVDEALPATTEAQIAYAKAAGVEFIALKAEGPDRVNTSDHLSCDSKMARLLDSPQAREVLERRIPDVVSDPLIVMARGLTLKQLAKHRQAGITPEMLTEIDQDLSAATAK